MSNNDNLPTWDEVFANLQAFITDTSNDEALARLESSLNNNK